MQGKIITASNAAELLGISVPTFYKLSQVDPNLAPVPSTGPKMWRLSDVLAYQKKHDEEESKRRRTLLSRWGALERAEG